MEPYETLARLAAYGFSILANATAFAVWLRRWRRKE